MCSCVTADVINAFVSSNIIIRFTVRREGSAVFSAVVRFRFLQRQRKETPLIRINWDGEPSEFAENPDNWIFLWKWATWVVRSEKKIYKWLFWLHNYLRTNKTLIHSSLYIYTYLLTPWSRVLLQKLTGSATSQEIPRIFGTRRFITVLTSARHLSLS